MSGPHHLPLIAWSRQELLNELRKHERAIEALQKEIERRGQFGEDKRYGFPIQIQPKLGVIETGYHHFPTKVEAFAAACLQWPNDESAPYKVHPVYLGKDDVG